MSNPKDPKSSDVPAGESKEPRLRGNEVASAEEKIAVDHVTYKQSRNPDTDLHLDGEDDGLYQDGLDLDDDTDTLAGTDGKTPGGVKG
jgi:hypothetical protein